MAKINLDKRTILFWRNLNNEEERFCNAAGNTKEGSITVPLTSCLTGLESAI